MNNIKKAVFYIIFKSKSTIFNMLGVGVLGTLMLVVFQQDQFYSKGTDYLILVFFVVLLGCTLLQANSIITINEQISNFAQTYPTNLKASSNEALLFMRRYRFANCSCFSCCFKDAYPSSNVQ